MLLTGCFGAALRPRTPPQPASEERTAMVTVSSSDSICDSSSLDSGASPMAAAVAELVLSQPFMQRRGILLLTPDERRELYAEMDAVADLPLEDVATRLKPVGRSRVAVPRLDMAAVHLCSSVPRPAAKVAASHYQCAAHLAMIAPLAAAMSRDAVMTL